MTGITKPKGSHCNKSVINHYDCQLIQICMSLIINWKLLQTLMAHLISFKRLLKFITQHQIYYVWELTFRLTFEIIHDDRNISWDNVIQMFPA